MKEDKTTWRWRTRDWLALLVLLISSVGILLLASAAINSGSDDAKDLFNIALPVFATWVGTVLAFYFTRENFETATNEVRKLVETVTPTERAKGAISGIMRDVAATVCLRLSEDDGGEVSITVADLLEQFEKSKVSRLPVLADDGQPRYMIHESVVDSFLAKEEDREKAKEASLKDFAKAHESRISEGRGFVVVSESTSIADAKAKMERIPSCQDIFVTKKGESGEMLLGWVSNIRLAKKIQA